MSSEEELGDSLRIKPPQAKSRDHRVRGDHHSSRSGHSSRDRDAYYSSSSGHRSSKGGGREEYVGRKREYEHESRSSRSHSDYRDSHKFDQMERISRDPGRSSSSSLHRSRDLENLSESKSKRRDLQKEEEKMLREIEEKRLKERGESNKRSRRESRSRSRSPRDFGSPDELEKLKKETLKKIVVQEVEISSSDSEAEEGEARRSGESESEDDEEERREKRKRSEDRESSSGSSSSGKSPVSSESSSSAEEDRGRGSSDEEKRLRRALESKQREREAEKNGEERSRVEDSNSPISQDELGDPKDKTPPPPLEKDVEETKKEAEKPVVEVEVVDEEEKDEWAGIPPYLPALQGCRSVEEFQMLNRIEEGTYGIVFRAKDKRTSEIVALKRLKMEKEKDGFPITSLREINTLLKSQHENIVTVREIVVGSNIDKIFLVMDYVEHDLKSLMETLKRNKQTFILGEVKCLLIQLLRAVAHMHDNWILHRDLKTSNLLLSHKGILKVGDFGLAREYGSPLKNYTPIVVTLWYRAPELLLGTKTYSTPIDVWSVGCIFGELLKMEPMVPGKSEANQLNLIFQTLGTPNDKIWPGYTQMPLLQKMTFTEYPVNRLKSKFTMLTENGIDLMNKFLTYNPQKRITAEEALKHRFFEESPLPIDPSIFPTWPAKSELGARPKNYASPKPPSGGRQFKDLREDDDPVALYLSGAGGDRPIGGGFNLKFNI